MNQENLRRLNCSNRTFFIEAFGKEDGDHYWGKLSCTYKGDLGKFLMYLDTWAFSYLVKALNTKRIPYKQLEEE